MADKKQDTATDAGQAEVQKKFDAEQEQGYRGVVPDPTPNENYSVAGVTSGAPTPETVNKGQSGVGTTVIATLALTTGVNLVAFDEKPFTMSVVAGATTVVAEDILAVVETHGGSGLSHSGGLIEIELSRT
jgi:carbamate kinase